MPSNDKRKKKKGATPAASSPRPAASASEKAAVSPAAAPAAAAKDESNLDDHPFAIGAHLLAAWGLEKSPRLCQIIERAHSSPDAKDPSMRWSYYCHWLDFNRRMDEWITPSRILEPPSVANKQAKGHAVNIAKLHAAKLDDAGENGSAPGSSKAGVDDNDGSRSRRRKRNKGDDDGSGEGGDGSGGDLGCPTVVADDEHDEHEGIDEASLREHEEVTKVKNVQTVELGRHIMEAWYFSPFPKEFYPAGFVERLYICEYSLRFFSHKSELERYQGRGVDPHPPGNEIYRHEGLAMFEVDGSESSEYCQNLCYLAKLFLDHKTLYYEVDPFLFYVMCTVDERGYHPTGFFSKEKYSDVGYNLACILTFPCYQRLGYGRFLIAFSYELSKKEFKVGSPEKPLSDLGAVSYRSYWSAEVLQVLHDFTGTSLSIMEISKQTSILSDDVINALQYLGILKYLNNYALCIPPDLLSDLVKRHPIKEPRVDPEKLHWAPLIGQFVGKDKWSIGAKRPDDRSE